VPTANKKLRDLKGLLRASLSIKALKVVINFIS